MTWLGHIFVAGHFVLDIAADEIADLVRRCVSHKQQPSHFDELMSGYHA